MFDAVFFEHRFEHANERGGIACRVVVPGVFHVLGELFAFGLEIRDLNNRPSLQTIVLFDSSVLR
jgi:hypothetical protein